MSFQNVWFATLLVLGVGLPEYLAQAQNGAGTELKIDDPRPVAKAVDELVRRYGYVITYEDPRYVFEDDLQDVTTEVRRDLSRYPPGKAPKVRGPRGGQITVNLPAGDSKNVDADAVALILGQLVHAQSNRVNGSRFRVVRSGDIFHVIPAEVRDQNGNWIAQKSILDVPISLPTADRSEVGMLEAIIKAVSAEARVKLILIGGAGVGTGLANPERPASYRLGADNEMGSDVLMRALTLLNDSKAGAWIVERLRWQLFYDIDEDAYFLNLAVVPDRLSVPVTHAAQPGNAVNATSSAH